MLILIFHYKFLENLTLEKSREIISVWGLCYIACILFLYIKTYLSYILNVYSVAPLVHCEIGSNLDLFGTPS